MRLARLATAGGILLVGFGNGCSCLGWFPTARFSVSPKSAAHSRAPLQTLPSHPRRYKVKGDLDQFQGPQVV